MHILPLLHDDREQLRELQPAGWLDIMPHIDYYLETPHCYPFKAIIDKKIIGTGTYLLHENTAWLAHIIVHNDYRNRGIGYGITKYLIDAIDKDSLPTISLISTDLGQPVYKKLGFAEQAEYVFYKDGGLKEPYTPSAHILPCTEARYKEVLALDKGIADEDRSVRLKPHLENAVMYVRNDKVEGCFFPGMVEGLVIASNPEAGIELMKLRLQTHNNAVVPVENQVANDFLLSNSFKEIRKATRMFMGNKLAWKPECIYNRVGGQIG